MRARQTLGGAGGSSRVLGGRGWAAGRRLPRCDDWGDAVTGPGLWGPRKNGELPMEATVHVASDPRAGPQTNEMNWGHRWAAAGGPGRGRVAYRARIRSGSAGGPVTCVRSSDPAGLPPPVGWTTPRGAGAGRPAARWRPRRRRPGRPATAATALHAGWPWHLPRRAAQGCHIAFQQLTRLMAAPGGDVGRRGLGLPLPNGAGTGPVAEVSCPRQPTVGVSLVTCPQSVRRTRHARRVQRTRRCRKLPGF
jgi:hypothetical protein